MMRVLEGCALTCLNDFDASEIRFVRAWNGRFPVGVIFPRVFGADAFGPLAQHMPVSNETRPWNCEYFRVVHAHFNLQSRFGGVRINVAAAIFIGEGAGSPGREISAFVL